MNNRMMKATDVMQELGVSRAKAYEVIRKLNAELDEQGYLVVTGKIPRAYWNKKFFGNANEQLEEVDAYVNFKRSKWNMDGSVLLQ